MKNLISILTLIAIVLISLASFGNTNEKTILVHAQGKVIRLNTGDISYLKSKCNSSTMLPTLNALNSMKNISNNDIADNILAIIKARK
jgi:hypothetical protein